MHRKRLLFALWATTLGLMISGIASAEGDVEAGKATFTTLCVSCHGAGGKGDGPVGAMLQPPPRDFTTADFKFDTDGADGPGTDTDLKNVISQGAAAFGGSPLMAPNPSLSEDDIADTGSSNCESGDFLE